VEKKLWSICWS